MLVISANLFISAFCAFIGVLALRFPNIVQRQALKGIEKNTLMKSLKFLELYFQSTSFIFMTRLVGVGAIIAALYNLVYLIRYIKG